MTPLQAQVAVHATTVNERGNLAGVTRADRHVQLLRALCNEPFASALEEARGSSATQQWMAEYFFDALRPAGSIWLQAPQREIRCC